MMSNSSGHIFQVVRQAARIEEIVGEHIALRPAGREFVGLCPFHEDRRPSMYVSPQKQIFYCFVCAAGGDVFKFVENYHKMSKGEALRFLAQRYGITLPEFRSANPQASSQRDRIIDANVWAAQYFQKNLVGITGDVARQYLTARGVNTATVERFQIGCAETQWTALAAAAAKKGISQETLLAVGLVKSRSDGSPYDVFRNRLMFPIIDSSDRVIAFGGRILPTAAPAQGAEGQTGSDQEGPKYLNSPETTLFSKRETLYALNLARQPLIRKQLAVVVEGYMDVVGCHQAGVENVVATLGTAMTEQHINLLRRFCNRVALVFDSDDAGRRAADRAIELLLRYPVDVRIAHVPDGKDPCDFCMTHGGEAFEKILAEAKDSLEYAWEKMYATFQASDSLAGKQRASEALMRLVAPAIFNSSVDPIRRGLLQKNIADLVGISSDEVHARIRRLAVGTPAVTGNSGAARDGTSPSVPAIVDIGIQRAGRWVIGALVSDFTLYALFRERISIDLFPEPTMAALLARLLEYLEELTDSTAGNMAEFLALLDDPVLLRLVMEAQTEAERGGNLKQKLEDSLSRLEELSRQRGTGRQEIEDGEIKPDEAARLKTVVDTRTLATKTNKLRRPLGPRPQGG
ncbi:MAG: DNA primase [Phycisphaerae bacterium]